MPNEQQQYDVTQYDRPSVTADIVIFTIRDKRLQVLLILRKDWPYENSWAIPGGFVHKDETVEDAARRELQEETGVADVYLEQFRTFSALNRDPRTWVITVAFTALIPSDNVTLRADTDAAEARWFPLDEIPRPLAFDHDSILDQTIKHLRRQTEDGNIAKSLLPKRFTLTQLQEVYEILLARPLDKRNFRKGILALDLVTPTDEESHGKHRPAVLYEFTPTSGNPDDNSRVPRFLRNSRA